MGITVTTRGRITLPKRVRDLLELGPGSTIDFERAADGRIVLVRAGKEVRVSRLARLRGHAGKGPSTNEITALTRGR